MTFCETISIVDTHKKRAKGYEAELDHPYSVNRTPESYADGCNYRGRSQNIYEERELDEFSTNKDFLIVQNEGELLPEATIRKYRIVQKEGKRKVSRSVDFYDLNMIISVGYRVKSHVATIFC